MGVGCSSGCCREQKIDGVPKNAALAIQTPAKGRQFVAFLSHHKEECGTEARFIKDRLENLLGGTAEVFLDSDDLLDLNQLVQHVKDSASLIVLQSSELIYRPWCLIEMYVAVENDIPIVAVNIRGKQYDFGLSQEHLTFLDTALDLFNPGASGILKQQGMEVLDVAYKLGNALPSIISTELNTHASKNVLEGSFKDLLDQIVNKAKPVRIEISKADWIKSRGAAPLITRQHGARKNTRERMPSTASNKGICYLPTSLPRLPKGYVVRSTIIDGIKRKLFPNSSASEMPIEVVVHGMGGAGKTVTGTAIAHEEDIRLHVQKICFIAVGQDPNIRALQRSLHLQLCGQNLPENLPDDSTALQALQTASQGQTVLLVIDDAWDINQVSMLNCVDPSTASLVVITTRIQGLIPDAAEFMLGLLDSEDAVRLLMEAAGQSVELPFPPLAYEAAQSCGGLPLVLGIAGGLLEQMGGQVTSEFVSLLKEDHGEALRTGDFGDLNVNIEDRVITASLAHFENSGCQQVADLFHMFAMFPEDVPVPLQFFDLFAASVFGGSGKRAQLQVRNSINALLRRSMLLGSLTDGVYQHDIMRHYCISRVKDLPGKHRKLTEAMLTNRPAGGSWPRALATSKGSVEHYVATYGFWHIRAAMGTGVDSELVDKLVSSDRGLAEACAVALGLEVMQKQADVKESRGEHMKAAQLLFATSMSFACGQISIVDEYTCLSRAQKLLEKKKDAKANELELAVLPRLNMLTMGFDRSSLQRLVERSLELSAVLVQRNGDNWEAACADQFALWILALYGLHFYDGPGVPFNGNTSQELERTTEIVKKCATRALDAQGFQSSSEKVLNLSLTVHLCGTLWSVNSRRFVNEGVLEKIGGIEHLLEMCSVYDLQDCAKYSSMANNYDSVFSSTMLVPVLLTYGRVVEAVQWIDLITQTIEEIQAKKRNNIVLKEWPCIEQSWLVVAVLPLCILLGLQKRAQRLARAMDFCTWNSQGMNDFWAKYGMSFGSLMGERLSYNLFNLLAFLVHQGSAASPEQSTNMLDNVRVVIDDYETVIADDLSPACFHAMGCVTVRMVAALAAEAIGNLTLADKYAELNSKTFEHCSQAPQCALLALRGRLAGKRGDRKAAVAHWEAAARKAMQEQLPLLAFCAGLECKGSEGDKMIEQACNRIGRPRKDLESELLNAKS